MKRFFPIFVSALFLWSCAATSQTEKLSDDDSSYRLGEGDQISIQVFDEPDLTMQARIGASGVINYSYLGDIKVAEKSTLQLEKEITTLLKDGFLVSPSVNVSIIEYRPFFINGEVRSPGGYSYQPGLTLDRAIALAGGLTDRASRRKMYILTRINNVEKEVKGKLNSSISPGDVITIKEGFF